MKKTKKKTVRSTPKRAKKRTAVRKPARKVRDAKKTPSKRTSRKPARKPAARVAKKPVAKAKRPATNTNTETTKVAPALTFRAASPQHRTASCAGGSYVLVSHDKVLWTTEWRPTKGRSERLGFREPLAVAEANCQRHRTLIEANALLVAANAGYLTGGDVTGDAVAWKRGRR
jgi:hypothetical protein